MYPATLQAERARANKTIREMADGTGISYEVLKTRLKTGKFNAFEMGKILKFINAEREKLSLDPMNMSELFDYVEEVD